MTSAAVPVAPGSVDGMHEASDADVQSETTQREPGAAPGVPTTPGAMGAIEGLPLADRAPRYQALADRLRFLCTVYDPKSGRYRIDYGIYMGMGAGALSLVLMAWVVVRMWLGARRTERAGA